MGATHRSKSTRASRGLSVKTSGDKDKLYEVLDHFGKALAMVETVARALEAAENDEDCSAVGAEIATLRQAVIAFRAVHEELDLSIPRVTR
jgi:hypothetical protein